VRRLLLICVLAAAMLAVASPALAYQDEVTEENWVNLPALRQFVADPESAALPELPENLPCWVCHGTGTDETDPPDGRSGPHGGYMTTTNKCQTCHSVHQAAGTLALLPAATVKGTCETCHDGTSGTGVYGVLKAYGYTDEDVVGGHRIDMTSAVPGGDPSTGETSTVTFRGLSGALTCSDCHSIHGSNVVEPFVGDRARTADSVETTVTSGRLLRRFVVSVPAPVDSTVLEPIDGETSRVVAYGSEWCGACHQGRLSGSGVLGNHPVDSSLTTDVPFYYDNVARVSGVDSEVTELGTLGRSNFGYVMPLVFETPESLEPTRTPLQQGHFPICQQCHEDARRVGNTEGSYQRITADEVFTVTVAAGTRDSEGNLLDVPETDNPRFQIFPHESLNRYLLVEPPGIDSLCLNCHAR
jgi:hypothetical protein